MTKGLRRQLTDLLRGVLPSDPPTITENSTLHQIAVQYPSIYGFLERKYGVKASKEERGYSLENFSEKYGLPPAQIVFAEVQLSVRTERIRHLAPREAKVLMQNLRRVRVLDVRERWEIAICRLPDSQALTPELLDQILKRWPKDTPIVLYCHFGIRSMDAASFLLDRGFKEICTIQGGIDAWACEIDPKLPRYPGAWC